LLKNFFIFLVELFTLLLLVVLSTDLLDFLDDALNVVLVLIDFGLIHVNFASVFLELAGLRVKVLLEDRKLLCSLKAGLLLHDFADLLDLLLLLMHQHLFLDYLLRLVNQSLLQGLYFLFHLINIGISAVEATTAVHIERILQLFRKSFHFEFFFNELVLQSIYLVFVDGDLATFLHKDLEFALEVTLFVV
jgi:hypothetical protein